MSSEAQIDSSVNVNSTPQRTDYEADNGNHTEIAAHIASPRAEFNIGNEGGTGAADSLKDSSAISQLAVQAPASSRNDEFTGSENTSQAILEQPQNELSGNSNQLFNQPVSQSIDPSRSFNGSAGGIQRTNDDSAIGSGSAQQSDDNIATDTPSMPLSSGQQGEDAFRISRLQEASGMGAEVNHALANREMAQTVKERIKRKRKARNAENDAGDKPRKRRQRRELSKTPEDAEEREIVPATIRMNELCKDQKIGRKSKLEQSMRQIDWSEVVRKRKEFARVEPSSQGQKENVVNERLDRAARERESVHHGGPQLHVVNGQMVVDQASLIVDRRAEASRNEDTLEIVEEDDLTSRVNSHSWLYDNRRDPAERGRPLKSDRWTADQTEAFYDALRMFGTDFYIISRMFPGKTRRQIKLKFVREERSNPIAVKAALVGETVPMDFDAYLVATGQEKDSFKDPKELEAELQAEDDKHKEEIERRKEEHAELMRQRKAAGADTDGEIAESSKENKRGKGKKARKATTKRKQPQQPAGGEEVEILGDA